MSEDRLLAWLRRLDPERTARIGDDAAFLPALGPCAVTVDSQIEGVHFPSGLDPAVLARRTLAVNLSDLAAVGAEPRYVFLALTSPPAFDRRRFFRAFLEACKQLGVELAGGDLSGAATVIATVTLLGTPASGGKGATDECVAENPWLTRSGAEVGQRIWIGGTLGESAAGRWLLEGGAELRSGRVLLPELFQTPRSLARAARRAVRRHLLPTPQLALGRWLAQRPYASRIAVMDLSDGLAKDLPRLCRESGGGAEINAETLPTANSFEKLCELLKKDARELALGGGEDYVLLFTLPEGEEPPAEHGCRPAGRIIASKKLRLLKAGAQLPWPELGWDHLELASIKTAHGH